MEPRHRPFGCLGVGDISCTNRIRSRPAPMLGHVGQKPVEVAVGDLVGLGRFSLDLEPVDQLAGREVGVDRARGAIASP